MKCDFCKNKYIICVIDDYCSGYLCKFHNDIYEVYELYEKERDFWNNHNGYLIKR